MRFLLELLAVSFGISAAAVGMAWLLDFAERRVAAADRWQTSDERWPS